MDNKTIRFFVTRVVQDEHAGTPNETRFEKGKTYTLPQGSADHWLSRQVAEEVVKKTPAKPVKKTPEPDAKDPDAKDSASTKSG